MAGLGSLAGLGNLGLEARRLRMSGLLIRDLKGKWQVRGAWPDWEIWAGRPGGSECEVFKRDLKGKWQVWGARPDWEIWAWRPGGSE